MFNVQRRFLNYDTNQSTSIKSRILFDDVWHFEMENTRWYLHNILYTDWFDSFLNKSNPSTIWNVLIIQVWVSAVLNVKKFHKDWTRISRMKYDKNCDMKSKLCLLSMEFCDEKYQYKFLFEKCKISIGFYKTIQLWNILTGKLRWRLFSRFFLGLFIRRRRRFFGWWNNWNILLWGGRRFTTHCVKRPSPNDSGATWTSVSSTALY